MSGQALWQRYLYALTGGPAPREVGPGWDGYTLWQRYWTSLLGFRLAPKNPYKVTSVSAEFPAQLPAREAPAVLHLPRIDRAALRTAGTASLRRQRQETVSGGVRYVLRDAGRDRLEILAESASDLAGSAVLPVTVTTPDRTADYLLLFRNEEPGRWVAAVRVPGFRNWADVSVQGMREIASLNRDDVETVARSVRAVPDPWVPMWQAVMRGRTDGDAVREAIQEALRS